MTAITSATEMLAFMRRPIHAPTTDQVCLVTRLNILQKSFMSFAIFHFHRHFALVVITHDMLLLTNHGLKITVSYQSKNCLRAIRVIAVALPLKLNEISIFRSFCPFDTASLIITAAAHGYTGSDAENGTIVQKQ